MAKFVIDWNEDGRTILQEAVVEKHQAELTCVAEAGTVKSVALRHSRGEEQAAKAFVDGKEALPMAMDEFKKLFKKGKIEIK